MKDKNNMAFLELTQQRGWECFRQEAERKRESSRRESVPKLRRDKVWDGQRVLGEEPGFLGAS